MTVWEYVNIHVYLGWPALSASCTLGFVGRCRRKKENSARKRLMLSLMRRKADTSDHSQQNNPGRLTGLLFVVNCPFKNAVLQRSLSGVLIKRPRHEKQTPFQIIICNQATGRCLQTFRFFPPPQMFLFFSLNVFLPAAHHKLCLRGSVAFTLFGIIYSDARARRLLLSFDSSWQVKQCNSESGGTKLLKSDTVSKCLGALGGREGGRLLRGSLRLRAESQKPTNREIDR